MSQKVSKKKIPCIKVKDRGQVYDCKIVDRVDNKIKIHFVNWNKSHDVWKDVDSEDIVEMESVHSGDPPTDDDSSAIAGRVEQLVDEFGGRGETSAAGKRLRDESEEEAAGAGGGSKRPSIQLSQDPLTAPEADSASADGHLPGDGAEDRAPVNSLPECRFCSRGVLGKVIVCGRCGHQFHPDTMCLGVDSDVVKALFNNKDNALQYNCCQCRSVGIGSAHEGNVDNSAYKQLLRIVGEIAGVVRDMQAEKRVDSATTQSGNVPEVGAQVQSRDLPQGGQTLREEVQGHVRELREREKREEFIVLRGLGDSNLDVVHQKFYNICRELGLEPFSLVGLCRIGNHNLYRARVPDPLRRKNLLLKAQELRHCAEFSRVNIS